MYYFDTETQLTRYTRTVVLYACMQEVLVMMIQEITHH